MREGDEHDHDNDIDESITHCWLLFFEWKIIQVTKAAFFEYALTASDVARIHSRMYNKQWFTRLNKLTIPSSNDTMTNEMNERLID